MKILPNSLYLKLLGWFTAASLLAIIATLAVVRPLWDALDQTVDQLPRWGQQAALAYESGGEEALHSYLRNLRREHRVTGLLFNRAGKPLTRLRMPPDMRQTLLKGEDSSSSGPRFHRLAHFDIHTDNAIYQWRVLRPPPGPAQWRTLGGVRLVIFLAFMALAALLFTTWLGRPIKQLRIATDNMTAGDLGSRVGASVASRHDEIGELGSAFNRMADRLQSLVANKERLLRDVSHELRSPLARLEVALELAREKSNGAAGKELNRIDLETQRLKALIDQVMTLARLDDPEAAYQFQLLNIGELLESVCEDLDMLPEADIRLEPYPDLHVLGNDGLLRSALENVIRNAMKYTAGGTEVGVCLYPAGDTAVIEVRDHGPGVPDAQLEAIFRPFYRTSEARTPETGEGADSGGYGVGLAIVKRVTLAHKGNVKATNMDGGGLRISLSLPLAN